MLLFHACACEAVGLVQGCVRQPSSWHGRGFRRAVSGPLVCVTKNTPQPGHLPRRLVQCTLRRAPWSSSRPENWADQAVDFLHCGLHALALACVWASCRDMRGLVRVLHLPLVRWVPRGQWAPLDSSPRCAAALIDLPTETRSRLHTQESVWSPRSPPPSPTPIFSRTGQGRRVSTWSGFPEKAYGVGAGG